jgi:hypothetical protein
MAATLPTLMDVAAEVRERLAEDARAEAFRIVADWYSRARRSTADEVEHAIARCPSTTDRRWDALLAGLTEQLCLEQGRACPRWALAEDRYLTAWWFMTPHTSLHPSAFVEAPAALANHGVFIHRADFESLAEARDLAGLAVRVASPRYILAMKLLASRVERDEDDIRALYERCGFTTAAEGVALVQAMYPSRPVAAKVQFLLEEMFPAQPG